MNIWSAHQTILICAANIPVWFGMVCTDKLYVFRLFESSYFSRYTLQNTILQIWLYPASTDKDHTHTVRNRIFPRFVLLTSFLGQPRTLPSQKATDCPENAALGFFCSCNTFLRNPEKKSNLYERQVQSLKRKRLVRHTLMKCYVHVVSSFFNL